jgi:site-specific recombinase XerD
MMMYPHGRRVSEAVGLRCDQVNLAQARMALPVIEQPAEKTKADFLARARALRDQAVKVIRRMARS